MEGGQLIKLIEFCREINLIHQDNRDMTHLVSS